MTTMPTTDTHYRGYLLRTRPSGVTWIYYGSDFLDVTLNLEDAHKTIDDWMEAK
jgi:Ni/Co efflux regulator RcnB